MYLVKYYERYENKWREFDSEDKVKKFLLTLKPSKSVTVYEVGKKVSYTVSVEIKKSVRKK